MNFNTLRFWLATSAALMTTQAVSGAHCKAFDLDFDHSGLMKGDYVSNQLKSSHKVDISVALPFPGNPNRGYAPGGAARIFDTSDPGTDAEGDLDLGSPNMDCPGGGPGVGSGGKPGKMGENCEALGNVLIIQEKDTDYPDDNFHGGVITFDFDGMATVYSVEILDVDAGQEIPPMITVYKMDGGMKSFKVPGVGNNGKATVMIEMSDISKLTVDFKGSGAVADLKYDICGPTSGGAGGDPHFRTFDGTHFSYHGECDLVMARSATFGDNLGLDLHARTHSMGSWSLISNAALRIGDDIFEFANDGSYYLNGHELVLPFDMAGRYPVTEETTVIEKTLEDGTKATAERQRVKIDIGNGDNIEIVNFKKMIGVRVNAFLEDTEGMLGVHSIQGMVGRDGEPEVDADAMGAHWQVRDTEAMLFREIRFPQYPHVCTPPTVNARRRLSETPKEMRETAEMACAKVDDFSRHFCVEDVLLTGDITVADNYAFGEAF